MSQTVADAAIIVRAVTALQVPADIAGKVTLNGLPFNGLTNVDPVSGIPLWCPRCDQAACDGGCGQSARGTVTRIQRPGPRRVSARRRGRATVYVSQVRSTTAGAAS